MLRQLRIGGNADILQYDDAEYDSAFDTDHTIRVGTAPANDTDVVRKADLDGMITPGGLSANRLVDTDADSKMRSVTNLTTYISGTANRIKVTNDGDGSVTIDSDGTTTSITLITSIQAGGDGTIGFQYKTTTLTISKGIVTTVGTESDWINV